MESEEKAISPLIIHQCCVVPKPLVELTLLFFPCGISVSSVSLRTFFASNYDWRWESGTVLERTGTSSRTSSLDCGHYAVSTYLERERDRTVLTVFILFISQAT